MERKSRVDAFAKAREEIQENQNKGSFTPREYEEIPFSALETGKLKVFRFVGDPHNVRNKPWHTKLVQSSRITDDNGKMFICRWDTDSTWFMWKVFRAVAEYKWDANYVNPDGRKGRKVYVHSNTFPKMLDRVLHNGKEPFLWKGKKIEDRGWLPEKSIYANVIDKGDYTWHTENKSFKLIAKKCNESEKDGKITYYPEYGIPVSTYDLALKTIIEEDSPWENYDIAIRKNDSDPWYEVYSAYDERKISKELEELGISISTEALTKEEESWKKIDIDKITQVTSYRKIQNRLSKFIKEVDVNLGTTFTEELEKLVQEEKERWAKEYPQEEKDYPQEDVQEEKPVFQETEVKVSKPEIPKEEPKPPVRERVVKKEETPQTELDVFGKMKEIGFKRVDDYKEAVANLGAEVEVDFGQDSKSSKLFLSIGGQTIPESELYACPECGFPGPEDIMFCPSCGIDFA